jgi:hypothetical protein
MLQRKSNTYYVFWACILILMYPAINAHVPYSHLWSAPFHKVLPHYFITARALYKNVIEYKMRVQIFCTNLSETFIILWRRILSRNVYWSSWKAPVILVWSELKLNFLEIFSKNSQILNFIKIRSDSLDVPSGQLDVRTDTKKIRKCLTKEQMYGEFMFAHSDHIS